MPPCPLLPLTWLNRECLSTRGIQGAFAVQVPSGGGTVSPLLFVDLYVAFGLSLSALGTLRSLQVAEPRVSRSSPQGVDRINRFKERGVCPFGLFLLGRVRAFPRGPYSSSSARAAGSEPELSPGVPLVSMDPGRAALASTARLSLDEPRPLPGGLESPALPLGFQIWLEFEGRGSFCEGPRPSLDPLLS